VSEPVFWLVIRDDSEVTRHGSPLKVLNSGATEEGAREMARVYALNNPKDYFYVVRAQEYYRSDGIVNTILQEAPRG